MGLPSKQHAKEKALIAQQRLRITDIEEEEKLANDDLRDVSGAKPSDEKPSKKSVRI